MMAVLMMLSVTACGNNTADVHPQETTNGEKEKEKTTESKKDEEINYENWGVPVMWAAYNPNTFGGYAINLPYYRGLSEGGGMVAEHMDGTVAILMGQNQLTPDGLALGEVYPTCFKNLELTLYSYYGIMSENYQFTIENDGAVTVAGKDMHYYEGTIEFDDDGEHKKFSFVSYAAHVEATDAYAYWVVYDSTADQSCGELITEYALNMAKTFREQD